MCGICGQWNFDGRPIIETKLRRMCQSIAHRGPDDEGIFLEGGIGLGNRRLSIIDLNSGDQPISNEDQSIWIVFNGEIYRDVWYRIVILICNIDLDVLITCNDFLRAIAREHD